MLKKMRILLLVGITAVLAACGGDGDSTPNFAGNYQISTLSLSSNTCGGSPDASIAGGTDTVVQNGRNVTISDGAASGTVDADDGGFTLTETDELNGVTVVVTFKFRSTASGASTFNVSLNGVGTSGNATCSITYTGTATKI